MCIQQDALKYVLDLQPGLAQVIGDSDGNRYIHSPRGVHAVNDGSDWTYPLTDGLRSVRGYTDAHSNVLSNVNYTPIGVPDTNITGPAFTGEWRTGGTGMQYHRARHLSPGLGVWLSRDPFEGISSRPMSLNGYSWVEGNVVNLTDASGECVQEELCEKLKNIAGVPQFVLEMLGCLPQADAGYHSRSLASTSGTIGLSTISVRSYDMLPQGDKRKSCQTFLAINQVVSNGCPTGFLSTTGINTGELTAIVIDSEWFSKYPQTQRSCQRINVRDLATEATARRLWRYCPTGCSTAEEVADFLEYYQPFRNNGPTIEISGQQTTVGTAVTIAREICQGSGTRTLPIYHDVMRNIIEQIFQNQDWRWPGYYPCDRPYGWYGPNVSRDEGYKSDQALLYTPEDGGFIVTSFRQDSPSNASQCSRFQYSQSLRTMQTERGCPIWDLPN